MTSEVLLSVLQLRRQRILEELFKLMADGRERTTGEIADRLSTQFKISPRQIGNELASLPQFKHQYVHNFHVWCLTEKPLEKKRIAKNSQAT